MLGEGREPNALTLESFVEDVKLDLRPKEEGNIRQIKVLFGL